MKKISTLIISILVVTGTSVAYAAPTDAPSGQKPQAAPETAGQQPITILQNTFGDQKSGLGDFSNRFHELSSVDPGADVLTTIIFTVIDFLKYLLGGLAVIFMIISGVKMITAGMKIEEVSQKEKDTLKYIIYGLLLVIIADELITKVFFGDFGECIATAENAKECALVGGSLVKGLYSFIMAILASLSIFVLAVAGFRMVTSAGQEDVIGKEKKRIGMAVVGLLVAGVAEFAVKGVVFPKEGSEKIDVAAATELVMKFTNFIAGFIAAGAFIMLFYGGYLYVASFGNEEQTGKAKKIIMSALIGVLIAIAAYGVVRTVTLLGTEKTSDREVNLPQNLPGVNTE